jgi:hypothetical protein
MFPPVGTSSFKETMKIGRCISMESSKDKCHFCPCFFRINTKVNSHDSFSDLELSIKILCLPYGLK